MKSKLSTLVLVLILSTLIFSGCAPPTVAPTELEQRPTTQMIELREGDTYTITLESSGYGWEVDFDETFLELVEHYYDSDSGQEFFTFRALTWGRVEVYFSYSRWHEVIYIVNIGVDPALAEEMTLAEAREIAMDSECAKEGAVKETGFYNDWSGTWWIDLDIQKRGCAPACVVNVKTKQAEINWRCAGVLPGPPPFVVIAIPFFILWLIWRWWRRKRKAA